MTLEEAAKKYINLPLSKEMDEEERYFNSSSKEYDAFIAGAEWQAKILYTEEDICNFVEWMNLHYRALEHTIALKNAESTKDLLHKWKQKY
jgi:hypothetical protein